MRRLVAPDMLAIERNGGNVTIASSRAPQTTFIANGVENREQLPSGGYSRVIAQLNGDQLTVRSAGNRATDFSVTPAAPGPNTGITDTELARTMSTAPRPAVATPTPSASGC